MLFDLNTRRLRLWITAAALGIGAMTFSAPADARGFGGSHGGGGGFHGGMGGLRSGMGGFQSGGMARGFGGFHGPVAFAHPGFFRSPFGAHRAFANRPFFFHRQFADRRFFFHRRRFVGPFAAGFYDGGYDYPYYDDGAYSEECFSVRRRLVNRWGYVVVRRQLVCG
jgi:hypothetical protein